MNNMKKRIFQALFTLTILALTVWGASRIFTENGQTISSSLIGNQSDPTGFALADGTHVWEFPADFGPHPDYQTEWWYYTGNLQTSEGQKFGYQLTFFRRGLSAAENEIVRESIWGGNQIYMGHLALSDISTGNHYEFERFSRGSAGLAGAQTDTFRVWLENWEVLQLSSGEYLLRAGQGDIQLEIILKDIKGPILQGIDGLSQKGPGIGNASYYFSQTRLESKGMIQVRDNQFLVTGLSWMDHEFSTRGLSEGQVGWDWFSIQLDDGTDLMMYKFRREDGKIDPFSSGMLISPNGKTTYLAGDEIEIQVHNYWRSPESGAIYPSSWTIQIPSQELELNIEPYLSDQEMNVSYEYWEGAVEVKGTYAGGLVSGSGYVELTGYAASMEGQF